MSGGLIRTDLTNYYLTAPVSYATHSHVVSKPLRNDVHVYLMLNVTKSTNTMKYT